MNSIANYKIELEKLESIQKSRKLNNDEFFMYFRIKNYIQAVENNLKYFFYQGEDSIERLEFCCSRAGKIFCIEELFSWKYGDDLPDINNYDPLIHLGGNKCCKGVSYCNHNLVFISEGVAEKIKEQIITNLVNENLRKLNDDTNRSRNEIFSESMALRLRIEETREELYNYADPSKKMIIDRLINTFANEVVFNDELLKSNRLELDKALNEITVSIKKTLDLLSFKITGIGKELGSENKEIDS